MGADPGQAIGGAARSLRSHAARGTLTDEEYALLCASVTLDALDAAGLVVVPRELLAEASEVIDLTRSGAVRIRSGLAAALAAENPE